MKHYERPTQLEEMANAETMTVFAEQTKQFKAHCKGVHHVEANLATLGNSAFHAALESSVRAIQTNDGTKWQHGVDLMENTSICHRRTGADLEFGIIEYMPMKSGEAKNALMNSDHSVRELLKTFVRDEQQLLGI